MMDASLAHLMSWTEGIKGDVPPPLTGPTLTVSPLSPPTVFCFGGKYVQTRRLTSEMWALSLDTKVWTKVEAGPGPDPRYFHSMDVFEDKLICFGGMSDTEPMSVHGDIWFFDCTTRKWLPPLAPHPGVAQDTSMLPSARYAHLSAVTRDRLVVMGGQDCHNAWIYEINIYDLRRNVWSSKTMQPEQHGLHSKGAYRSLMVGSKRRVIQPPKGEDVKGSAPLSYTIEEEGQGGDLYCYSNYDFAKVRREFDVISPDASTLPTTSKYNPPPGYTSRDESRSMRGTAQPPGLRFPTGGIVGNHLILCGLYLASSSSAYSVWSMDLTTRTWRHLEPTALSSGSWNRAVLWAEGAKLLVFGNTHSSISDDYSKRAVNLDNMTVISLETYGIYSPPKLEIPPKIQEMGLSMMDEKLASDFDVICEDGRKIKCSRRLLAERWSWFAEQDRRLAQAGEDAQEDAPALDINDTLLGGFGKARLAPTNLTIKEAFPVCVALVQYFYTLNLSTPLQNRAPVITALLFLAKQYHIDRLAKLAVHALHERLDPANASHMYEIATLAGEQDLQVRCLVLAHASKGLARSNRQNPKGAQVDANGAPPAYSAAPGAGSGKSDSAASESQGQGRHVDGTFRQARIESFTLGMEDAEHVANLLEAIALAEPHSRPESPIERAIPRVRTGALPPARPPPLARLPSFPKTPELDSRDQFDTSPSSSFPSTPAAEPLRESFILPHGEHRSHAPLETLHETDSPKMPKLPLVSMRSYERMPPPPPLPAAAHMSPHAHAQAHAAAHAQALAHAPTLGRLAPPSAYRSYDAQSVASSACPSLTSSSSYAPSPYRRDTRHDSMQTDGSSSSEMSMAAYYRKEAMNMPQTPTSVDLHDYTIALERGVSMGGAASRDLSRQTSVAMSMGSTMHTDMSDRRDVMSISSGSTGTSSKQVQKLERKIAAQVEKEAKKAEQRAKFEQLRAEQQKKLAISRAAAQRKAEVEAEKAPEPKKVAKSKLGKFGQKLADSVLFPEGGKNGTYF